MLLRFTTKPFASARILVASGAWGQRRSRFTTHGLPKRSFYWNSAFCFFGNRPGPTAGMLSEVNVPRKIVVLASLGSCHCHGHSKPGKHHESVPCALTCAATASRGPSWIPKLLTANATPQNRQSHRICDVCVLFLSQKKYHKIS